MPRVSMVEINGNEVQVKLDEILKFQREIERLVNIHGLGYFESIVEYCDTYNIEVETIKPLISEKLLSLLHEEASVLNLIIKEGQLPV